MVDNFTAIFLSIFTRSAYNTHKHTSQATQTSFQHSESLCVLLQHRGSKKCEHKVAFPLSCPIKIAICPSPCSTIWKAVCLADNVEMTDCSIQGGFSAVCLPRAINRREKPKEGEGEREGGGYLEIKEEPGQRR